MFERIQIGKVDARRTEASHLAHCGAQTIAEHDEIAHLNSTGEFSAGRRRHKGGIGRQMMVVPLPGTGKVTWYSHKGKL